MACLPVSTIALSGVITRMPLVCISIVASAFQYGWAPTLMPATTTLTSPPCWVCSTRRRSTRATQSRFSLPESMAILAPADSANHSIGTSIAAARSMAASSRTALGLGDRAHRLRRVAEHGDAGHALGVALGRRADDADDDAGPVLPRRPVDGHEPAVVVEVVLDERPAGAVQQRHQLVGVDEPAAAGLDELAGVVVERLHRRRRRRR